MIKLFLLLYPAMFLIKHNAHSLILSFIPPLIETFFPAVLGTGDTKIRVPAFEKL